MNELMKTYRLEDLGPSPVDLLVVWAKPHGVYQRLTDGCWFIWRGKRGWLRVRSKDMLAKLAAEFGKRCGFVSWRGIGQF